MKSKFKCIAMSCVFAVTLSSTNIISAEGFKNVMPQVSKLTGYEGIGYCSVKQRRYRVKFEVRVTNLTPNSIATAWLKFDDETVGRLDGTVADSSGAADFKKTFRVGSNVSKITVDVRDHNRSFSTIISDDDLAMELSQSKNAITGESIRMGTCTFDNQARW